MACHTIQSKWMVAVDLLVDKKGVGIVVKADKSVCPTQSLNKTAHGKQPVGPI